MYYIMIGCEHFPDLCIICINLMSNMSNSCEINDILRFIFCPVAYFLNPCCLPTVVHMLDLNTVSTNIGIASKTLDVYIFYSGLYSCGTA